MNIEIKINSLSKENEDIILHDVGFSSFEDYLRKKTKFRRLSSHKQLSSKVGVSFSTVRSGAKKKTDIKPIDAECNNNGIQILFSALSSERMRM